MTAATIAEAPRPDLNVLEGLNDPLGEWRDILTDVSEEDGLYTATVGVEFVQEEAVATNKEHVEEIKKSIEDTANKIGGTGQLTRINVAYIPGEPKLLIADGFHRAQALHELGRDTIKVTIQPNMTWEELIDQRILTASLHQSVKFERVIDWVGDAWKYTPWADKLDVSQAFALSIAAGMTGERIGLTAAEAAEIKAWVFRKSEQWQLAETTIYSHLSIAKIADPTLLEIAQRGGSRITQQHLKVIAQGFPNDFEAQQLAAGVVNAKRLSAAQAKVLVDALSQGRNLSEVRAIAGSMTHNFDWSRRTANPRKVTLPIQRLEAPTFTFDDNLAERPAEDAEEEPYISPEDRVSQDRFTTRLVEPGQSHGPGAREKILEDKYVTSEIELARGALQAVVLRGRYIAVAPNSMIADVPQIPLDLLPSHWRPLVKPAANAAAVGEQLLEFARQSSKNLSPQVKAKFDLTLAEARQAVAQAIKRIEDDLDAGALQFAPPTSDWHTKKVLFNTVDDQSELLRKAKLPSTGLRRPDLRATPRHDAVTATSIDILRTRIAKFGATERRALILATLFHLPTHTIAQAMQLETDRTDRILQEAARAHV